VGTERLSRADCHHRGCLGGTVAALLYVFDRYGGPKDAGPWGTVVGGSLLFNVVLNPADVPVSNGTVAALSVIVSRIRAVELCRRDGDCLPSRGRERAVRRARCRRVGTAAEITRLLYPGSRYCITLPRARGIKDERNSLLQ
jgi:hypothetical protein